MLDAIEAQKGRSADPVREFVPGFGVWSDDLDGVLKGMPKRGILFSFDYLRVGYFWGGDGEKNIKLDMINLKGQVVDQDEVRLFPPMKPMRKVSGRSVRLRKVIE